jgi:hypothetical protein
MQLLGLQRFTHSILPACNYCHWHLELSVDLSEAEGCRDHERRFGRGSPDLRWAHRHLFRKVCKFLWNGVGAENLAKEKRP